MPLEKASESRIVKMWDMADPKVLNNTIMNVSVFSSHVCFIDFIIGQFP
jgi:hypothetical protein